MRRAPRLFSHIRDVLGVVGLTSPIGQDYGTLLRTHMLAVPAYCEASSSLVFQGGSVQDGAEAPWAGRGAWWCLLEGRHEQSQEEAGV